MKLGDVVRLENVSDGLFRDQQALPAGTWEPELEQAHALVRLALERRREVFQAQVEEWERQREEERKRGAAANDPSQRTVAGLHP